MKEQQYTGQEEIDLKEPAVMILKTLLLLDKPYSAPYLARLLSGESRFGWRDDSHPQLETFGSLEAHYSSKIQDMISYLEEQEFVTVKDRVYGTLEISELGKVFLQEPRSLMVSKNKLSKSWYEVELIKQLRNWRVEIAREFYKKPYQIFTNYTLEQIVKHLPASVEKLNRIEGLDKLDDTEKKQIIEMTASMTKKVEKDKETGIYRKAHAPAVRKVKELFEAGLSLEETARRRKLEVSTVSRHLITLHEAEEIDLIPWIEEKMDPLVLHKVAEYFRSAEDKSIEVAHKVLQQNYDTLELCKLYSKEVPAEAKTA